jgi:hypothetical protein
MSFANLAMMGSAPGAFLGGTDANKTGLGPGSAHNSTMRATMGFDAGHVER